MRFVFLRTAFLTLALAGLATAAETPAKTASPAKAKPKTDVTFSIYGKVENFEWKEYGDSDEELLKESGPLFSLGGSLDFAIQPDLHLEGLGELFFGSVDYDGQTQTGVPATTTTDYAGLRAEGRGVFDVPAGRDAKVKPFAGAGGRAWLRKINDSDVGKGYEESWITIYGFVGLGGEAVVGPKSRLFGSLAVRLPIFNQVIIDWSNIGGPSDITVNPGEEPSFTLEGGLKYDLFTASVFYETFNFSKSDADDIGSGLQVWQPKSEARIIGLKAGLVF